MALIGFYFLCAFLIYAASDFLAWRKALRTELIKRAKEQYEKGQIGDPGYYEMRDYIDTKVGSARFLYLLSKPVSILRALLEFAVPVILGIYAILLLLFHKIPAP